MDDHQLDILCITHAGGTVAKTKFNLQQARIKYPHYYIQHIPIPNLPPATLIKNRKD
jgi:hypothetical protein